ncbi:formate dehydrogenase iron-sulfur subunit [Desulfonauticus submarinus]|uniref:Formate dehydrogenase iron-sulfur subunit n=1 Tax=Desulfonauticus submarinus TaxID=206665 RepID=A0A1H0BVX7_9BACT|nr:4Fe-4S dicluster domain-containing protein [Desulfonauticus submarinus]SDN49747.1 formate dehydrogenase iron-sulfur subunit [Desulfonauticus submarinus]
MEGKAFFIDLTRCTACRGCQIACKEWHKLPAEETKNWGSHQNPKDLSYITYKLVRMKEVVDKKGHIQNWLFFPEQCRHCLEPPCKMAADDYDPEAIIHDPLTGAVIFTEKTKNLPFNEIREACPYNIPRQDPKTKIIAKCDMCIDRVQNGLLPICVKTCPTGAMNFGDRKEMVALAKKRLAKAKKIYPHASLGDLGDVRVIYLFQEKPNNYYEFAVASLDKNKYLSRKELLAKAFAPLKHIQTG